jgi:hypothetical protein
MQTLFVPRRNWSRGVIVTLTGIAGHDSVGVAKLNFLLINHENERGRYFKRLIF